MELEEIVSSVLDVPRESLTDQSSPVTIGSWSSLAHINLIVAIEEVYTVSFTSAEIRSIKSLADFRRILRQKGVV